MTGPPYLNRENRTKQKTLRRQPSLRSQLNQIRLWVRQGRTDAWIAHKIDVSIDELSRFKREHQLEIDDSAPLRPADPLSVPAPDPFAEELEEEPEEEPEEPEDESDEADLDEPARPARAARPRREGDRSRRPRRQAEPRSRRDRDETDDAPAQVAKPGEASSERDGDGPRRRRRGRRGGRRHRSRRALEATFDHGEEGYGLWLDPAVVDNPVYSEHWAGHRAVTVTLEPDAITIRRAGAPARPRPPRLSPSPRTRPT